MNFDITILGTSSALPVSERFPSSQVVNIYGKHLLVDCGEGTQIQLRRFRISFGRINHIFISHLHGDHYFGLFGLLSTYELLHRTADLHIYAPEQLRLILSSEHSPVRISELPYPVHLHDIPEKGGLLLDSKNFTVWAFELKHKIPTYGFLFREKQRQPNIIKEAIDKFKLLIEEIVMLKAGKTVRRDNGQVITPEQVTIPAPKPRSYAYVSDTAYYPQIVEHLKGVDVLYHEATFDHKDLEKAQQTYHSTAVQAAMIAQQAQVGQLILGHFSATIRDFDRLLKQAQEIFPNTVLAYDGMKVQIPLPKRPV